MVKKIIAKDKKKVPLFGKKPMGKDEKEEKGKKKFPFFLKKKK